MPPLPFGTVDAPKEIKSYSTTFPANQGSGLTRQAITLPRSTVWDVMRAWAYIDSEPLMDDRGFPAPNIQHSIGQAFAGLYRDAFQPNSELAMFSYISERKRTLDLQQVIRIGWGQSLFAVVANASDLGSAVTVGVDVLEYQVAL